MWHPVASCEAFRSTGGTVPTHLVSRVAWPGTVMRRAQLKWNCTHKLHAYHLDAHDLLRALQQEIAHPSRNTVCPGHLQNSNNTSKTCRPSASRCLRKSVSLCSRPSPSMRATQTSLPTRYRMRFSMSALRLTHTPRCATPPLHLPFSKPNLRCCGLLMCFAHVPPSPSNVFSPARPHSQEPTPPWRLALLHAHAMQIGLHENTFPHPHRSLARPLLRTIW